MAVTLTLSEANASNSWITETAFKRRIKLSIIAEILEISKEGALKTQIMYRANLGFVHLTHYLEFMSTMQLIRKTVNSDKVVYVATEKGLDFLRRLVGLTERLKVEPKKPPTRRKL